MIRSIAGVLFIGFCLLTAAPVSGAAENVPVSEASWLGSWLGQQTATGDWRGLRSNLEDKGVTLSANFTTDTLGNPAGGLKQAARYAGFLQVSAGLDLEKIASFQGWALAVSNYLASGSSLSDIIGNFYGVQQIYVPGSYYFGELDLSLTLPGDKLTLEAGRLFAGDVFAKSKLWQYYVGAINSNLVSLSGNIFFPNFQVAAWGARATYEPNNQWQFAAAIYDANPKVAETGRHGADFNFSSDDGCLVVSQLTYSHHQSRRENGLPGSVAFGGYYESSKFAGIVDPSRTWRGNYGLYLITDQMIYRGDWPDFTGPSHLRSEAGYSERVKHPYVVQAATAADRPKGLSIWGGAYVAPQEDINPQTYQLAAGLIYQGLPPNRSRDVTAFSVIYGHFNDKLPGQDAETVLELNHRFQVSPWCYITPDIQYIIKPNGQDDIDNALVLGAEASINF